MLTTIEKAQTEPLRSSFKKFHFSWISIKYNICSTCLLLQLSLSFLLLFFSIISSYFLFNINRKFNVLIFDITLAKVLRPIWSQEEKCKWFPAVSSEIELWLAWPALVVVARCHFLLQRCSMQILDGNTADYLQTLHLLLLHSSLL